MTAQLECTPQFADQTRGLPTSLRALVDAPRSMRTTRYGDQSPNVYCLLYFACLQIFDNCACFDGPATKGYCESDVTGCSTLYKYITVITLGSIVSSFARTPNSLIALRAVDPMDKGFAIGIASTFMDIFGMLTL